MVGVPLLPMLELAFELAMHLLFQVVVGFQVSLQGKEIAARRV